MKNYLQDIGVPLKRMGFDVIPIKTNTKNPGIADWSTIEFTESDLIDYSGKGWESVGLRTGTHEIGETGLYAYVIDIDILSEDLSMTVADIVADVLGLSGPMAVRVGRAPKCAFVVLSLEKGLTKLQTGKYADDDGAYEVEILGAGQQSVVYGQYPNSDHEYSWIGGLELMDGVDKLPVVTKDDIDTILRRTIVEFEKRGLSKNGANQLASTAADASHKARKPVPSFTIDQCKSLMEKLEYRHPTMVDDYDGWLKVGMALHHQFSGSEEALAVWNTWSAKSKSNNANDCPDKWRSFTSGDVGVTLRSLLKLPGIDEWWVQNGCELGVVEADYSKDDAVLLSDDDMSYHLVSRYAHVKVGRQAMFYDFYDGSEISKQSLIDCWTRPPVWDEDAERWQILPDAAKMFLRDKRRKEVAGLAWYPLDEPIIDVGKKKLVNTFEQWTTPSIEGDVEPYMKIARHICGDHTELVLDWMAFAVQKPAVKCKWQILVHGAPRTGKTTLFQPWVEIFQSSGTTASPEQIKAGWDNAYVGKKAVVFAEVWAPGNRQFFNNMKSKLADEGIDPLNRKGQSIVTQPNLYAIGMCSNHQDALSFDETDDKLLVIEAPDERMAMEDYDAYYDMWHNRTIVHHLHHFLLHRDISQFKYGLLPVRTQAAKAMAEASKGEWEHALDDMVDMREGPLGNAWFTLEEVLECLHEKRIRFIPGRVALGKWAVDHGYYRHNPLVNKPALGPKPRRFTFWCDTDMNGLTAPEQYSWMLEHTDKHKAAE